MDVDYLPHARDYVKSYAAEIYGDNNVCSIGTWLKYKPKLAILDSARVLDSLSDEVYELTKNLPNEFDDQSLEESLNEYPEFKRFYESNKEIVDLAYKMVGRIKAQGKHAGGLLISSVRVKDHIPLTRVSGHWTSSWTEGRNTQLSKFGFVKFDFLGLKTMLYIWNAKNLIKSNRGISIDFTDINPEDDRAGWVTYQDGSKHKITFSDEKALGIADRVETETIFQFDTPVAKDILRKGGVKSFNDLIIYTSMGRPGPMPMIDVYLERRDDKRQSWKLSEDSRIIEILNDTYGIIVFQEQIANVWRKLAGFTAVETEAARKAVAKKWVDKLAGIEKKWIKGASKSMGVGPAKEWWDKMVTFGRYAFNKAHATCYGIISYRSLWLKAHYPTEWWASVLSHCAREKMIKYVGVAKKEGINFTSLDVNKLSKEFNVKGDNILPGLLMIKGIGKNVADKLVENTIQYKSIEEFIDHNGSSKTFMERLIKLGAFDVIHKRRKPLWLWWLYTYGKDKQTKQMLNWAYRWTEKEISSERDRQIREYQNLYPNRKKIPNKILNWLPTTPAVRDMANIDLNDPIDQDKYKLCSKIKLSREDIERISDDFKLSEILKFEKEYLGLYFENSPMKLFKKKGDNIQDAKITGRVDCVINEIKIRESANGVFVELEIIDGIESARLMVWNDDLANNNDEVFVEGLGITAYVRWNDKFNSFNLKPGSRIMMLEAKEE